MISSSVHRASPRSGTWRDGGYANDYVEAMWLMLQQPQPDDYVIATGETYLRPTEVDGLCGDATKAAEKLDWQARTTFRDLVRLILERDLADAGIDAGAVTGA